MLSFHFNLCRKCGLQTIYWFLHFVDRPSKTRVIINYALFFCEYFRQVWSNSKKTGFSKQSTSKQKNKRKYFTVELACQLLCAVEKAGFPQNRRANHVPAPIVTVTDTGQKATIGRLKRKSFLQVNSRGSDTSKNFQACDLPFCLVVNRNCFLGVTNNFCGILLFCKYCTKYLRHFLHYALQL